jgi:hypothetical protein
MKSILILSSLTVALAANVLREEARVRDPLLRDKIGLKMAKTLFFFFFFFFFFF